MKQYSGNAAGEAGTKGRKKPVLFRWFVSYLVILVIPLMFSAAVYFYSYHIINKNSEEIYQAALDQFRTETDNYFGSIFQTLQALSLNNDIQILTLANEKLQPKEQLNIVGAVKELRKYQLISPLIDNVFVVLNTMDTVITADAYMSLDLFYQFYYQNNDMSLEKFRALVKQPHRNEVFPLNNSFLIFQAMPDSFLGDNSATLAISVKRENIEDQFMKAYEDKGGRIFILDNNGKNIYASGPGGNDTLGIASLIPGFPLFSERTALIGNVPYRVIQNRSPVKNWQYIYLVPESLHKTKARQIQFFTFAGLLICSFLGLLLAAIMTKRLYDPEKKLLAVFYSLLPWSERIPAERHYRYSRETEEKLVNLIRAGEEEPASALLRRVFDENESSHESGGKFVRLLAYDMLGSLIRGVNIPGVEDGVLPDNFADFNFEAIPTGELMDTLENISRAVCRANSLSLRNKRERRISVKVKKYIDENYRNPDINISITSLHFDMNPTYLSQTFKEDTGIGLLDYINSLRIAEGKGLLEQGCRVSDAAERAGFRDTNTFIRIFKKITGITPGQYKENLNFSIPN
jgi:AraC-like DNA-binding protein